MKKEVFKQRVKEEILILDGVFGTMLQSHLPPGGCVDMVTLDRPDLVADIYSAYVKAGTDILSTNTFGASRIKLHDFGHADKVKNINYRAAQLAKKMAGDKIWVAGVIGPTGKLVEPMGKLSFDQAYETFREQALALAEGGVDLFLLETFSDLKEIKAAVIAIREHVGLPIIASMTFGEDYLCFTGTDPVTAANMLVSLNADALGVNCSTGPEPMLEVVGRYAQATDCPIAVEPNAGIPRLDSKNKNVRYQISSEEMAAYGEKFVQIGANIVGTCCGSTPEYTAALRKRLKHMKPVNRSSDSRLRLSSRVHTVAIGPDSPFCIIGERINPTNREELANSLQEGKVGIVQKEAERQTAEGAHLLDLNIGIPEIDEAGMMAKAVRGIENVVKTPLVIDSVNPAAVEAALMESAGKPLINSVNGDEKSLQAIIPLAAKYGAGLLCLAVDGKGIPKTAEERVVVLKKIIERAEDAGIGRRNLICDCLTLTVSAQQKRAEETLKAVRMVVEELNLPTVLGVSNISFGLPQRSLINATFLSMAMSAGLDAAIINPGDERMMETVRAASVLTVRDKDSRNFVKNHVQKKKKTVQEEPVILKEGNEQRIFELVLSGNKEEIGPLVEELLQSGKSAIEINETILIPAIQEVGKKYDRKEIFLPQMILAAETMQQAFAALEPHFSKTESRSKGTVVLCTVKGDVHDIGKNIVGLFLKNQGFRVIDLGKDVSAETIVEKSKETKADVIGLSSLMTTTMTEMPVVIDALRKDGSKAKVVVGGAVVTKKYAGDIGADGFAKDGVGAVEVVAGLIRSS